jgi:hypothetical protein
MVKSVFSVDVDLTFPLSSAQKLADPNILCALRESLSLVYGVPVGDVSVVRVVGSKASIEIASNAALANAVCTTGRRLDDEAFPALMVGNEEVDTAYAQVGAGRSLQFLSFCSAARRAEERKLQTAPAAGSVVRINIRGSILQVSEAGNTAAINSILLRLQSRFDSTIYMIQQRPVLTGMDNDPLVYAGTLIKAVIAATGGSATQNTAVSGVTCVDSISAASPIPSASRSPVSATPARTITPTSSLYIEPKLSDDEIAIIVGSVVGGVLLILLTAVGIYFIVRRNPGKRTGKAAAMAAHRNPNAIMLVNPNPDPLASAVQVYNPTLPMHPEDAMASPVRSYSPVRTTPVQVGTMSRTFVRRASQASAGGQGYVVGPNGSVYSRSPGASGMINANNGMVMLPQSPQYRPSVLAPSMAQVSPGAFAAQGPLYNQQSAIVVGRNGTLVSPQPAFSPRVAGNDRYYR